MHRRKDRDHAHCRALSQLSLQSDEPRDHRDRAELRFNRRAVRGRQEHLQVVPQEYEDSLEGLIILILKLNKINSISMKNQDHTPFEMNELNAYLWQRKGKKHFWGIRGKDYGFMESPNKQKRAEMAQLRNEHANYQYY